MAEEIDLIEYSTSRSSEDSYENEIINDEGIMKVRKNEIPTLRANSILIMYS